jgi:crotonobetainyl-CoA:carnitine CoA-transferase CaiB-like acyl-CoA transferase
METVPGPLNGITVIDLGQIYNGPYCTFLLARAGATVIKVEPPGGENMRRRGVVGGAMLPFAMLNSNKNFVSLNLKTERGKTLLIELVRKGDVLLENFAPGAMDRLGLGPSVLMAENPRLIYAAGSGYGWSGPYTSYPAMDLTVQAMSGVMNSTGYPDGPPTKAGPALCDFFGGVHLYGAVTTALFQRERTGKGQFVEVSMLESVYFSLSSSLGLYFGSKGEGPPRTGNRHGGLAESPYNVYPTSDGWVAIICVTEGHWQALTEAMARPDLREDPRLASLKDRVAHMDLVDEVVSAWTKTHSKEALFAHLLAHRIPCAPVRDLGEVMNDPHLHARGSLRQVEHPVLGDVILPTGAMRYGGAEPPPLVPSKELGADNEHVFCDWLGLSRDEFAAMQKDGVV